ncbi:hypothetical protein PISMIDRAFT_25426 [Pisolithus microcarpus 441]|uniref:Uncharacterized protein n=1 Tax=Pisolithus microcarpus 441 TaxID=765257 RepID=A0A0C9YK92_9AGAM|nr:hypothetical protein PISMIDRAFT_25426 [Pisolithus microcarpus 441]
MLWEAADHVKRQREHSSRGYWQRHDRRHDDRRQKGPLARRLSDSPFDHHRSDKRATYKPEKRSEKSKEPNNPSEYSADFSTETNSFFDQVDPLAGALPDQAVAGPSSLTLEQLAAAEAYATEIGELRCTTLEWKASMTKQWIRILPREMPCNLDNTSSNALVAWKDFARHADMHARANAHTNAPFGARPQPRPSYHPPQAPPSRLVPPAPSAPVPLQTSPTTSRPLGAVPANEKDDSSVPLASPPSGKPSHGSLEWVLSRIRANGAEPIALRALRRWTHRRHFGEVGPALMSLLRSSSEDACRAILRDLRHPPHWVRRLGQNSVLLPVVIRTLDDQRSFQLNALLDSGASGCYIDERFARAKSPK